MGHGSMHAALIYQHATTERDRHIADVMEALVEGTQAGPKASGQADDEDDDGPAHALVPVAQ
jgi:hypothetical protein